MRHALAPGRHERRRDPSPVSYVIVLAAAVAALIAACAFAGQSGTAQARPAVRDTMTGYVTRTLDKAAHVYSVRAGDSISAIAARRCGAARDWTGIYAASRLRHLTARDANVLTTGQHLWITCSYDANQLGFAATSAPVATAARVTHSASAAADPFDGHSGQCGDGDGDGYDMPCSMLHHHSYQSSGPSESSAPSRSSGSPGGYSGNVSASSYSGYQACVIQRESGGSSQVMNSSGHYGLYQFDAGTWASGGGNPGDFGHASVAEQNRVFAAVYAARGTQPWSPSDGC